MATVANRVGLRSSIEAVHGSTLSGLVLAALTRADIPTTRSCRKYRSPMRDILPSLSLPPEDLLSGVNPIQAARSRPLLNCRASPMVATRADAFTGPTKPRLPCQVPEYGCVNTVAVGIMKQLRLEQRLEDQAYCQFQCP